MATPLPSGSEPATEVQAVPVGDRTCTVHVLQPRRGADLVLAPIWQASAPATGPTLPFVTLPGDLRDRWQFDGGPWRWLRFAIRPLELTPGS
jgi:hypothetical protein